MCFEILHTNYIYRRIIKLRYSQEMELIGLAFEICSSLCAMQKQ